MQSLKLSIALAFIVFPFLVAANLRSSETLQGQKGLFRLLSADINEKSAYHFRTSMEYAQHDELLKDVNNSSVRITKATLGFGYALLPQVLLSGHSGFNITSRKAQTASGGLSSGQETLDLIKSGAAITGTYDVGQWMNLDPMRFTAGLSLWMDLSKITRFFQGVNIVPTLIATGDFIDNAVVPFRVHGNLGFRPANGGRYFDSDSGVSDFERTATETINSFAMTGGAGVEFPMGVINPSLEFQVVKVANASVSRSPKWVTAGLKGRPFPQKNIELFGALDVGLSSFSKQGTTLVKPEVGALPLWNVMLGFGISQFGRRAGEISVDELEYNQTKRALEEKNIVVAGLQKDLEYNTVQGRVVDALTKMPMEGVTLSFPESADLKPVKSDADGRFVRYFRNLAGARLLFSKEGYESSSKFLALKPGERLQVDIELKKSTTELLADFVATIATAQAKGIPATVTFTNIQTGETTTALADASGQVILKLREGTYRIEMKADGFKTITDQIEFNRGKTVLRSYTME